MFLVLVAAVWAGDVDLKTLMDAATSPKPAPAVTTPAPPTPPVQPPPAPPPPPEQYECAAYPLPPYRASDTGSFTATRPGAAVLPSGWIPVGGGLALQEMNTARKGGDDDSLKAVAVVIACRPH